MENMFSSDIPIWLPIVFFFISVLYSMVGFGGGSSYLAILALIGLSYQEIPPVALICNLTVTLTGFFTFYKNGHFRFNRVFPFLIGSIPMAYLGSQVKISEQLFSMLLGVSLIIAATRMMWKFNDCRPTKKISIKRRYVIGIPIGGVIGLLSGIVGIGGGIFLSPIMVVMRWVNIKEAAACASLFIIFNSAAALAGHMHHNPSMIKLALPLGCVVFVGGQIGSRLGSQVFPEVVLRPILSILVFYVSIRMLLK